MAEQETKDRPKDRKSRHDLALARFKLAKEAYAGQRKRELEALKFAALDQWPEDVKISRQGEGTPGTPGAVAARPMLTIDKVGQPIQQVTNAQKNARLAIKVSPKSTGASQQTADAFQGLIRNIEVDSNAAQARNWAYERMAQCGLGYYRIHKEYANDGDFDQDIVIKRILNQGSVYLDPFAQEADWSDGQWALITEDLPQDRYKQLHPKAKIGDMDDAELTALGDRIPDWVKQSEAGWSIRVAEYWYVRTEVRTLVLVDGPEGETAAWADELPDGTESSRSRLVSTRKIQWCLIDGVEILEETDWDGRWIPIIPVVGKEYNLGGPRRWMGIVEPAMDGCKLFNYAASAVAEATAIAPKAPFVLDPEQITGFQPQWDQANVRNFPWLGRRAFDDRGNPYPPIERQTAEPPIQALSILLQQADGYIKATTGVFDPSLGNLSAGERSGKAILALQKQSEQGNSNYLDNMATISMQYEGRVLLDLIPKVYDRPGRQVRLLGIDDKATTALLGQPYLPGPEGQPQPVPPGTQGAQFIDLAAGEYSVVVEVGKAFSTRREEATGALTELMGAAPQLAPIIAPFAVQQMDFPGANDMADVLMKTLPPNLQPQEDGQPPPELQLMQAQQQLQQQGHMLQLMTKELEKKTQIIETDAVKANYDLEQTKIEQSTRLQIAEIQAQTQFGVAEIKVMLDDYKLRLSHIETILGHDAAAQQARMQQEHEAAMAGGQATVAQQEAEAGRGFEQQEAEAGRQHEAGMAGQQQAFEAEQAEREAAQQQPTEA